MKKTMLMLMVLAAVTMVAMTLVMAAPAWAADKPEAAPAAPAAGADKEGVSATVYNGGYAVVREVRNVEIGANGEAKFTDVAQQIDATTVHFKSLSDPKAKLLEQNYQYDLVSADKLLQKYIDKEIEVVCAADKKYAGTLMSFDGNNIVLKGEGGLSMIQRADNVRDIRFKALPEGLLTRPTLVWQIATDKPGKQLAEVMYQTGGMGWHAEYVLVLDKDDATADLSGWVSVQNNSGKTYTDAKLKFIAGDVRRVQPTPMASPRTGADMAYAAKSAPAPMEEKAFFEYHMYTLPRPSTVADNEVKQLEMFPPVHEMKVEKKYCYQPLAGWNYYGGGRYTDRAYGVTSEKKVQVYIEFKNEEKNGLGIPLPAGKVRVYKGDPADKAMEFVGEEKIDHTPKDERLSLQIGNAFDIVGERIQRDFRLETGRNWMSETIEVKVRNHKKEDVTVRIKEPLYRWSTAKVTEESVEDATAKKALAVKHEMLDAHTAAWDVPVKADGETKVTFTVEYTW
jgi:hypothetical protein